MKGLITIILLQFSLTWIVSPAQDTVYYYGGNMKPVESFKDALVQKKVKQRSRKVYKVETLYKTGGKWHSESLQKVRFAAPGEMIISETERLFFPKIIRRYYSVNPDKSFSFQEYYKRNLIKEGKTTGLVPLHLEDTLRIYYPDGSLQSVAMYENNQLTGNRNWLPDGSEYIDNIYYVVNEVPEYVLGNKFFKDYIFSGLKAAKVDFSQINDKIVIGWVVMEDGRMEGIRMVSGKITGLGELLIKLLEEMPGDWKPARLEGEVVRYFMEVPFNFQSEMEGLDNIELRGGVLFYD